MPKRDPISIDMNPQAQDPGKNIIAPNPKSTPSSSERGKNKKRFSETKFGGWVTEKFLPFMGDAASGVIEALPSGNPVAIGGAVLSALFKKRDAGGLTPEESDRLTQLQVDYFKMQADLEIELAAIEMEGRKIDALDRDSARRRDVDSQDKGGWMARNIAPLLAISVVVFVFIAFYVILYSDINESHQSIVSMFSGGLIGVLSQVANYYFGSSSSSSDKSKVIERAISIKDGSNSKGF